MLIKRINTLYKLLRPIPCLAFLFCFLFGALDSSITIFPILLYTFFVLFFIWGPNSLINLYSDIKVDKKFKHIKDIDLSKQPFVAGEITKSSGLMLYLVLVGISLFVSFNINMIFFFLTTSSLVLGILYSSPPIRAKGIPIADIIFNSLGGTISYLLGWSLTQNIFGVHIFTVFWLSFLLASTYTFTIYDDYEEDKGVGIKTTAVFLGKKLTNKLSAILFFVSLTFYFVTLFFYKTQWIYWCLLPIWIYTSYSLIKSLNKMYKKKMFRRMKKAISLCFIIILLIFIEIFLRTYR